MDVCDDYAIYESSDEGSYESDTSDDELRSFIREEYGIKKPCSGFDRKDFENEMEQELDKQIKLIESNIEDFNTHVKFESDAALNKSSPKFMSNRENSAHKKSTKECTQDSDHCRSSADLTGDKQNDFTSTKDEDLLYDPEMDNEDQKWIDDQRRSYVYAGLRMDPKKSRPLPNSDAILNCPSCLSLLCLDCQRHEIYKSQYRAMFVTNCTIDVTQKLHYPQKKKLKKALNKNTEYSYNPVKCSICNTSVAVYDEDEVYHFFNVISSFT